jgi:hypothetical protein
MLSIFRRVAASVPNGLVGTLEDLLMVKPDENSSGLQAIKANPSKPSVCDAHFTRQTEGSVNGSGKNFAIVDRHPMLRDRSKPSQGSGKRLWLNLSELVD